MLNSSDLFDSKSKLTSVSFPLTFTSKGKASLDCNCKVKKTYFRIRGMLLGGMYFSSIVTEGIFSNQGCLRYLIRAPASLYS